MVVCPKTGLPLVHSGSRNYNGTLKKKHPQETNKSSHKTTSMEDKSSQGKNKTLQEKKKPLQEVRHPSITYHWKFAKIKMIHFNNLPPQT